MADDKKVIHVISHTHWDREWYMPFEAHRFKLVEFFDRLLDTLDNDPTFKSFHLDGQAIVIEDYLEVRPEMREKIEKYIEEGRLVSGPWYILQDEYLVDGESNVRNMIIGRQVAAKYGKVSDIGYFPDAFGNIGQAPQILRGFDIDCVAFGRGTSPRKGDRYDSGEENYGKNTSEIIWRSPDGSEVIGTVFLNWYNNGAEIPSDAEEGAKHVCRIRDNAARVSTVPHLLFMNGCDHQPVQKDIGQVIEKVRPLIPDDIKHSNFRDYFDAIKPYKDRFGIFVGELDGEYSDGWGTLVNTASSRIYLKQLNTECEALLEKRVEPMSVYNEFMGDGKADRDYFRWMWKTLLQNHPHDSICGCSHDWVHSEMVTRFRKVLASGGELEKREKAGFVSTIDTSSLGEYAATVFNPNGFVSSEPVTVNLDLPEDTQVTADKIAVFAGDVRLPVSVEDMGVVFDYILPDDRFRIPFYIHRFAVSFVAKDVPAGGYRSFAVRADMTAEAAKAETDLTLIKNGAENENLRIVFLKNGTARITRKGGRAHYSFVTGELIDTCDAGDEYNYRPFKDGAEVSSTSRNHMPELICADEEKIVYAVKSAMTIPAGIDREKKCGVGSAVLNVAQYYTLYAGADRVDVKTVIENNADNHRLVVVSRPEFESTDGIHVYAEGQYDVVERNPVPWEGWKNPTHAGRMTCFCGVQNDDAGMIVATRGLAEYEYLRDGKNSIAVTLHRGADQLGDWGVFPTPEAQCHGTLTVEYSVVPYRAKERESAFNSAFAFAAYAQSVICGKTHGGVNPAEGALIGIEGKHIVLSAMKPAEERESVIVRIYNPYSEDGKVRFSLGGRFNEVYEVNLGEVRGRELSVKNGSVAVKVPAKKIMTFEFVPVK